MCRLFVLVLSIFTFSRSVHSDVSHLVLGTVDPFYAYHPVFVSSTPSTLLPEITANSANRGFGYHYEKPDNKYLPPSPPLPPQADVPDNGYLPPAPTIPLADPPTPTYLPPVEHIDENLDGIFVQNDAPQIVINIPTSTNGGHTIKGPGYHYEHPTTTTTTTTTSAPVFIAQADPPDGGYLYEPPRIPTNAYLPPLTEQRFAKGFNAFGEQNTIQMQLTDMRCYPSQGGYFKSVLTLQTPIYTAPIVDNDIVDSRCDPRIVRNQIHIGIAAEDFQRCGVTYCGTNLCLRMRFPLIRGMRTGGDSILTLQCKVQDRIVSKTHALKVGVSHEYQSRSAGALAQGGSQQPFRTHLELLRKTANGFTKYLEPSGTVQLGEDLQLRAHVRAGDGWNFTRLADVNLQRVSSNGEIINSAALVTPSGCINPSMRTICPGPPIFEPPLGHRLTFKAAMFQGMRSGDELLMSVKIVGCMDQKDCFVSTLGCDRNVLNGRRRRRRETIVKNGGSNATEELSETTTISFRVQMPDVDPVDLDPNVNFAHIVVGGILVFISLICLLAVLVYLRFSRKY